MLRIEKISFSYGKEKKKNISYEEVKTKFGRKEMFGDTYLNRIADIIEEEKQKKYGHLIIIIDGNVGLQEINKADEKIKK